MIVRALAIVSVSAVAAYVATLAALPGFIMGKAIATIEERGTPLHSIQLAPRATADDQIVVRSSPDLAYSICLFDLSEGAVEVRAAAWSRYGSLSVYGPNTDNLKTVSLGPDAAEPAVLTLHRKGERPAGAAIPVEVDGNRGIVLIRRLAPTPELYGLAADIAREDSCGP